MSTPMPEELAAALVLAESKSWLTDEKCFAALDTLDHMVPRNSDDALEVHEEVNGILASAYRAQAAEVERLKAQREQEECGDGNSPLMLVYRDRFAELQSQLAREKARAEEAERERDVHYARAASLIFMPPGEVVAGDVQRWCDEYAKERSELQQQLAQAREAQQWRPIETAPKDGTFVLVAGESGYVMTPLRVSVCRYLPDYRPLSPWVDHGNNSFEDGGPPPHLWMPLPAAPQQAAQQRGKEGQ